VFRIHPAVYNAPAVKASFQGRFSSAEGAMKLSEIVAKVSGLNEAISDYWEAELPKRHPNYPLVNPGEDDDNGPPPPEEEELEELLRSLPEDKIYQLLLVLYIGRQEFDTSDLPGKYQSLKERYDDPREEASVWLGQRGFIADFLATGVDKLKRHNIDVDHLPIKPARPARRR
jgi:hypothetical protein